MKEETAVTSTPKVDGGVQPAFAVPSLCDVWAPEKPSPTGADWVSREADPAVRTSSARFLGVGGCRDPHLRGGGGGPDGAGEAIPPSSHKAAADSRGFQRSWLGSRGPFLTPPTGHSLGHDFGQGNSWHGRMVPWKGVLAAHYSGYYPIEVRCC